MKIWDGLKSIYAKVGAILDCAGIYLLSCLLDNISSAHFPPGIEESNPFSRHPDGTFWLKHALITEGVNTLEAVLLSAVFYIAARRLGSGLAKFAAGLPWIYFAYLHFDAAVQNLLIEIPGLYQNTAMDMLRHLLGS